MNRVEAGMHRMEAPLVPFGRTVEQQKQIINEHISRARDDLLNKPRDIRKSRKTYDIEMNMATYGALKEFEHYGQAYHEAKRDLDGQTAFDIETMLGERCNVLLSSYRLYVRDGQAYPEGSSESLLEIVRRGQQYRENNGSNAIDREKAEVAGVEEWYTDLCRDDTPLGEMYVCLSKPQPGTIYIKDFFDAIWKTKDENGAEIIEVKRYGSNLSIKDSVKKAQSLNSEHEFEEESPAGLLQKPIRVVSSRIRTPDDVQSLLHAEHGYTTREDFDKAIDATKPFIHAFLDYLATYPDDAEGVAEHLDVATIKFTRELKDIQEEKKAQTTGVIYQRKDDNVRFLPIAQQHSYYKKFEVETVMTGCGISGGARVQVTKSGMGSIGESASSPFGVAAFGMKGKTVTIEKKSEEDYDFDHIAPCAGCIQENDDHREKWVGPCALCRDCDKLAKKGILKKAA